MADSYKILKYAAPKLPDQYRNMVFAEFLRSLRFGNEYFKLVDSESYFQVYHAYFSTLLNRPEALIKLAALSDDPDVILGWALIELDKVHYVYVKKDFRRKGIARALITEPFTRFTHVTKTALLLWPTKFSNAKFNPFC